MIKKSILITLLVSSLLPAVAQATKPGSGEAEVRILADKPTVYISFERAGKRSPLTESESDQGVWLRLHNNSIWAITFAAFGVPAEYGEVGLFYDVESFPYPNMKTATTKVVPAPMVFDFPRRTTQALHRDEVQGQLMTSSVSEVPKGYSLPHLFSTYSLPSGKSVVFSVPREHLNKRLAIRTPFHYEWEGAVTIKGIGEGHEPLHYVYFSSYQIPNKSQ